MDETRATNPDDADFVERLARVLELSESGTAFDLEEICSDRPELIPAIEEAIAEVGSLKDLHERAAGVDVMVGQLVGGRYELRGRIGSGGMGVVYRATDTELRREVAVKMLRPEIYGGAELEARLAREAEVLASVRHPAVVSVFDRGRGAQGHPYLVMPLLEGLTASELLETPPHPDPSHASVIDSSWLGEALDSEASFEANYVRQVATWIASVARGLDVVHAAGVVHRDVKPSNIFIQRDGTPVLLDFGLVTFGSDSTLAERDAALGTPAYMAPEQLDARTEPAPTMDVYGLAATMYHLLTFERPFRGSASQVMAELLRSEPVPPEKLRPGLPRDLLAIMDKGLAKEPRRRYETAAALAEDLEAWLDLRPVVARPVSRIARVSRRAWRLPAVKALVAVAVLALLSLGIKLGIDARAASREATRVQLLQTIPSTTLLTSSALRRLADPELDAAIGESLRQLRAFDTEPEPARIMYAGYLRQRGDYNAAAWEMQRVAEEEKTPVMRALARAYADHSDQADFPLEGLPDPQTDADRFALAYHLMWEESWPRIQRAAALMKDCKPGNDIVDSMAIFQRYYIGRFSLAGAERFQALNEAYGEVLRQDQARGYRTALSAKGAAILLLALERHIDAAEAASTGLKLAPGDFSLWQNLGLAQLNRDQRAAALGSFERQLELQPRSFSGGQSKLFVYLLQNDFEAAEKWLDSIAFADGEGGRKQRARCEARILLGRAMADLVGQGRQGIRDFTAAVGFARAAEDALVKVFGKEAVYEQETLLSRMLQDGPKHVAPFADSLARDPLNCHKLRELAVLMPDQLDEGGTRALSNLLFAISLALAPGQLDYGR